MRRIGLLTSATIAMAANGFAFAQSEQTYTYLSVMGTYTVADDARNDTFPTDIDSAGGFEVILGQQPPSLFGITGLGYELMLFGDILETGVDNGTDYYRYGVGANATYALNALWGESGRDDWTPYALLGAGAAQNDVFPDDMDELGWFAQGGFGVVSPAFNQYGMKARFDATYLYDGYEDGYGDPRASFGIEVPLWGEPRIITETVETVKVVEVPKEVPVQVEIDNGLRDSDDDGIVDSKDQCPNTPADTRVDGSGCPLGDVVELKGVTFELNSDRLRPDAKTILDDIAAIMARYPEMIVEVAGHTDATGSDAYNQQLSQKRAESVRSYLISQGVAPSRMSAVGYGESEPVASNDNQAGREKNRRVEMRIQN